MPGGTIQLVTKGSNKPKSVPKATPFVAVVKAVGKNKKKKPAGLNKNEKKQVKNIIADRKEKKYCPNWINYDYYDPDNYTPNQLPQITGSIVLPNVYNAAFNTISIVGLQTGAYLNSASAQLDAALTAAGQGPCMNALGGYGMEKGDTSTTIDGDYAYFHSGCINLQINSLVASGNAGTVNDAISPLCFRVIHVRAKSDAAGVTPSLTGDLFRDMVNSNAGLMSDMTLSDVMHDFGFNRERFSVENDIRFKLSEPIQPTYNNGNGSTAPQVHNLQYPTEKRLKLWLHKPKKKLRFAKVDNGLTNDFEPLNYDFVNYIFILCAREQNTNDSYSSTQKRWTVVTKGQTKYRDC